MKCWSISPTAGAQNPLGPSGPQFDGLGPGYDVLNNYNGQGEDPERRLFNSNPSEIQAYNIHQPPGQGAGKRKTPPYAVTIQGGKTFQDLADFRFFFEEMEDVFE